MAKVVAIGHVGMKAKDLGKLTSFYRDVVGLDVHDSLPVVSIFRMADGNTDLFLSTYDPGERFDLATDDLEGFRARLLERSVECSPIRDDPPTHRSFVFTDPEGNRIRVMTAHQG